MSIDRAGNMTVAILLLIAGCVMTAKFHAFGGTPSERRRHGDDVT
jgi:hypothetical protein